MDRQLFQIDLENEVRNLGGIVRQGNIALHASGNVGESAKDDGTIVTDIDIQINTGLALFAERKGVGFVGEEGDGSTHEEYVLNVDSLDGTDGFVGGTNVATIIATLMKMDGKVGTPILAVMYEPLTDRMWTAVAGERTHFNGRPLSDRSPRPGARIRTNVCAFPSCDFKLNRVNEHVSSDRAFARRLQDALGIGAGQICSNLLDVVAVSPTAAVEAPAMQLLVEGVGGVALDLTGSKLGSYEFGVVRGKPNFILPKGGLFANSQESADAVLKVIRQ